MNYWKLGCNWGSGKPDFYEMIKSKSIVICWDYPMSIGDIVAVCKGHKVHAIVKIVEDRKSCTSLTMLEEEFKKYQINFEDKNHVAKASYYELPREKQFEYKLQQGICQIQKDEIINKITSLIKQQEMEENIKKICNQLTSNHNLILTGAPGTGKTYLAKQIAEQMNAEVGFVQFHPSYDYTDFVEGLRPTLPDANGNIGFERKDGVFMNFCRKALESQNNNFVFIIDEINRGEISKIFGELFFSIDSGYRGKKGKVSTQYANLWEENFDDDKQFYVPDNVYIIGTMNDIDRSVESMDFAFRRRFAFKEIKASENIGMLDEIGSNKDEAIGRMKKLNNAINEIGLNDAYHIGGAYFLKLNNYKDETEPFTCLWNNHLEPLLKEYLRGNAKAGEHLEKLKTAYNG